MRKWVKPVFAIVAAVSTVIWGARQLGLLESWELNAFDQMMRLRPAGQIDERLLIIEITEEDIIAQQKWPLPDRTLAELLGKLIVHQPLAVGLDIFRDFPLEPGHQELMALLGQNPEIVPVCKVSSDESFGVAPPAVVEPDRAGFADVVVDPGGIVRRGLIFVEPGAESRCQTPYALSFQLARRYLAQQGMEPELTPQQQY